jgi:hypothetical protein
MRAVEVEGRAGSRESTVWVIMRRAGGIGKGVRYCTIPPNAFRPEQEPGIAERQRLGQRRIRARREVDRQLARPHRVQHREAVHARGRGLVRVN